MSSQKETSTQPSQPIQAPRHFPGFEGNWVRKELRPYLIQYQERVSADTDLRIYSSSRDGLLPQDEYYGGHNRLNDGEYGVVPNGYFVYRHMSDDTTFKFNVNNTGQPIAVSKEYPVFKTDGINPTFFRYLLNESVPFKKFAAMQRKGGTRTRLYFKTLCSWRAPLPNLAEQEQIADCLASIDALIEAETEKLDALKDHKQGLMQQLFPAEGESLPALRFPEFRSTSAWTEKAVSEVFEVTRGRVLAMSLVSETKTDEMKFPVYSSQTKRRGLCGYYSEYLYQDAITWTTDGAGAGDVNFRPGQFFCTNVCGVLLSKQGFANPFMAALLNRRTRSHVSYHGNPKLMNGVMGDIMIPVPSLPEQQRISGFLVEMDSHIEHQEAKIEQLNHHKQGLLQQLFPVLDEVDG
ncbi:restriction endonuclease subunit S [Pseudooceanicola nitratireducens]|uniref:restriction endonuclease subunit S n=1 Tax=Pseudooceanicola nitratireducens TaxID=517719 RepID=UPI001C97DF74|nr:restriction endonuclease subunit S [Pseudooceanicola nitratireducens]MBY6166730.1 restriction endonuclease subunit S [Pseudooceanicola nitratireducens]